VLDFSLLIIDQYPNNRSLTRDVNTAFRMSAADCLAGKSGSVRGLRSGLFLMMFVSVVKVVGKRSASRLFPRDDSSEL
jgi:hypothetical protein